VTWRGMVVLAALVLGACATAPRPSPLVISYHWDPTPPLPPTFGDQPPPELSIRWQPGTLSPSAVDQLELVQCLEWDGQPAPIERQSDSVRFRCEKPARGISP
jgi:hypothetical protein